MSAGLAVLVASGLTVAAPRIAQPVSARFQIQTTVTTRSTRTGDAVPLVVGDAFVLDGAGIPAGSAANGVVMRAVRPGRVRGRGEIEIAVESVTAPDGRVIPVRGSVVIEPPPRRPPMQRRPPTVPILAGMAAGYGTAALASQVSNSAETIAGAGVIGGLGAGILVGVLQRGEDWVFPRGETIDVTITAVRQP